MKKNIKKVLVLGSSALKIGEAGEFDYSGSQAIKALKEEGIFTVLINPNIATIQTSESLADKIYFLPVTPEFVEQIIQKEKPDGVLLSFGGQTALNCGLDLYHSGILKKYNVDILGTPPSAIQDTEDRGLFNDRLDEIEVKYARNKAVGSVEEALEFSRELGFPVIIRIAFALGGLGSGVCRNEEEVIELAEKSLSYSSQILVEEYLEGWKEIEYEVVRDKYNNCITVCNMENMDPMGIHTGESIVVAPSQTLNNHEYQKLRSIAQKVVRHLGIVGECNIQYALDPKSSDYRVIEVNARLSRSSALASKATGYPLAFIAAKLSLGFGLHELKNPINKSTSAFFEPALDYTVVKMPRWDLKKFRNVKHELGSSMKSVGEVMAFGKSFEEAIQKAVRMLEIGKRGLIDKKVIELNDEDLKFKLANPTESRIFYLVAALRRGFTVEEISKLTFIDKWFLFKIKNIVDAYLELEKSNLSTFNGDKLLAVKKLGFSDFQIAEALGKEEEDIYNLRKGYGLFPSAQHIDSLAGEYPTDTNYIYLTYNAVDNDCTFDAQKAVIILGSGPYRIGSSVEFDWCCVNSVKTTKELGFPTIMINCNPETVSTDYDEVDFLFFEELTFETVREIYNKFEMMGIIVSVGGQTPNNLAMKFHKAGMQVLGTNPEKIDRAEDRNKFSSMLDTLDIEQPEWKMLTTRDEAVKFCEEVGYPVLIRPSYVLSGAAMAVVGTDEELFKFLDKAADISKEYPTVISKFMENAKELEFDGVANNGHLVCYAISEHVENAGVHSGDATLVTPPQRTYLETTRQMKKIAAKIAQELNITGPFNIQFIAKRSRVLVIECNVRASRSFPFISKTLKTNFIEVASRVMLWGDLYKLDNSKFWDIDYVCVKAPEFSFTRLKGADPTTGVEMASTGEVACFGNNFNEAFLKSLVSVGFKFPIKSILISSGTTESKADLLEAIEMFRDMGVKFYATVGTAQFMEKHGLESEYVSWPSENDYVKATDIIKEQKVDMVINIPKNYSDEELNNDYVIRRAAVDYKIPLVTNRQLVKRLAEALTFTPWKNLEIKSWDEY